MIKLKVGMGHNSRVQHREVIWLKGVLIGSIPSLIPAPYDLTFLEEQGLTSESIVGHFCETIKKYLAGQIDKDELKSEMSTRNKPGTKLPNFPKIKVKPWHTSFDPRK